MERIARDDRHREVKVDVAEPVSGRMFGDGAMRHDPAATWVWSQREVADGAVDRAGAEEITGSFLRFRDGGRAPEEG